MVDDDEDYVLLVQSHLTAIPHFSCAVHWEPDFDKALAKVRDKAFDVCFVDYLIGARNGIEFIQAASRAAPRVPLILLTGSDDPSIDAKASSVGASDFISKSDLSATTLSRTIRFALANVERNNALRLRQAELEETMRSLEEQRTLLQLAMDHTKHGIAMFDASKRLIAYNAKYLEIYGFSPAVMHTGMSLDDILRYSVSLGNYSREDAERILAERLLQASSPRLSTYQQRLKDGRTIAVNHKPIAGGRSVTTCEDITEPLLNQHRSAKLARSAALADAEALAKTKFLSNMSHELRTPLNAIIGFTDAMRQELFGPLGAEQYKAYADHVIESASSLLRIVEQTIEMSLLFQENLDIVEEELELADLISRTIQKYAKTTAEKRIAVGVSICAESPKLRADVGQITQAIENIVDNAVKFCPPDGVIAVSVERSEAGDVVITVSDTGGGIPEDRIEAILIPFEQEEPADTRHNHGAGLGLPIARGLIRLHGGDVNIESEVGVGTIVKIRLPADRVIAGTAGPMAQPAA
ncbi:MAG: PAS-domain containing protein [Alphaproteobacteria bacterium]|nr:PAS-domain containing protein [Alphaproteobacteria bacterium]